MERTIFTIQTIHTLPGASLVTLMVLHAADKLPYLRRVPRFVLALVVGELLTFLTTHAPTSVQGAVVEAVNGLLVSTSAIGGWHLTVRKGSKGG